MEPRKKQKKRPTILPLDFTKNVSTLFNKQFKNQMNKAEFIVKGDLYPDEILLCISLVQEKALRAATMYLSLDVNNEMNEKPEKITDFLKSMVDAAASWFHQSFSEAKQKGIEGILAAMDELQPAWQKFEWDGNTLYVKLNKDNHVLEIAADRFLRDAGFSADEDEEDDAFDADDGDPDGERKLH